ncbi:MAG: murein biosynthesis integral membrane protein MurJ [Desulfobacteraceae bacterium]|nr:murein biosynthesis integral membrane protein MurJ [Desulfobacteraceae bacterium]
MTDTSLFKKVTIASFIMMASVFLSRIIGLFREMTIAYTGGAKGLVDAYQIAFIIPEILNHVVASGFLSITFIPIFAHYLTKNNENEGWKVFSIIFNTFGLLLLTFIAVSFIFAPSLVNLLAPGIKDPVIFKSAVKMTRIIIPAQFFFFTGGLLMAVQFAKEKFFIPALAPLIYNIGIITGGLLLGPWLGMEGFAWGVLAGSFIGNFLIQLIGAKKVNLKFYFIFNLKHPDFKKYIILTIPLMIGLTMTFSTEIFLKFFGSYLAEGSIAALNYALRIMFILVGLFGQAVGVASYPFMAKLAEKGDLTQLNSLLNNTLKFLLLVIPFSILFMVLKYEIVVMIFQRGRFDAAATILTSSVLPFLMTGTFAFAAQTVVARGFYATRNTLLPAIFSTVSVLASLPLFFFFMKIYQARGIGLALSLSAILQTIVLYEIWNFKTKNIERKEVYKFFLKISCISILIGIILLKITQFFQGVIDNTTFAGALSISLVTGVCFLILISSACFIFKIQEFSVLFQKIKNKLKPNHND